MPFDSSWDLDDENEDEELQAFTESAKDVILFCIDASKSMLAVRDDEKDMKRSHLTVVLQTAVELQKRKVIHGPNDLVGILLYNTREKSVASGAGGDQVKDHNYILQPISQINALSIQELIKLVLEAVDEPQKLEEKFPPSRSQVPMGDVFNSCNWILRYGAPKTAVKRIFLVTDEDSPHSGNPQLEKVARTTVEDLYNSGVVIEPFFISTPEKPFDPSKFYANILNRTDDDDLPEALPNVIEGFDRLFEDMRIRETPKRSLFSIPFHLGQGFTIGIKGYGLVTTQTKGAYKYFADQGQTLAEVTTKTVYIDENLQGEVDKDKIVYGLSHGSGGTGADEDGDPEPSAGTVKSKAFFTSEQVKSFRTLDLQPGLKLLGFKDKSELGVEDNIKHATFIYPDETAYTGSVRTFNALLKSMHKKEKMGLLLGVFRRNSAPFFYAMLPQLEVLAANGIQIEPPGFHLIPLPFADDIRAAPIQASKKASKDLKKAARAWIDKLSMKKGGYQPDANPNPGILDFMKEKSRHNTIIIALSLHYAQLEAHAFHEDFDGNSFDDMTAPKLDMIHKRAGPLMKQWKEILEEEPGINEATGSVTGSKRKAPVSINEAEVRERHSNGTLSKLTVDTLKMFLRSKNQGISGTKAILIERIEEWIEKH